MKKEIVTSKYSTKKCPDCMEHIPITETKCPACNIRVGGVNKIGFAEKPINWLAYMSSVFWFLGLSLFVWWAFIKG